MKFRKEIYRDHTVTAFARREQGKPAKWSCHFIVSRGRKDIDYASVPDTCDSADETIHKCIQVAKTRLDLHLDR
jgi:hypothetical protein